MRTVTELLPPLELLLEEEDEELLLEEEDDELLLEEELELELLLELEFEPPPPTTLKLEITGVELPFAQKPKFTVLPGAITAL